MIFSPFVPTLIKCLLKNFRYYFSKEDGILLNKFLLNGRKATVLFIEAAAGAGEKIPGVGKKTDGLRNTGYL